MRQKTLRHGLLLVAAAGVWFHGFSTPAMAEVKMSKQIEVQADQKTVNDILAAFNKAEKALQGKDLDDLMTLYSKDYNDGGVTKNNLRDLWKDLFAKYHRITSHHSFSKIVVAMEGNVPTARLTCTGGLWATSETTGERIIIDSWFEELHRLVFEDGAWRILGHNEEDRQAVSGGTVHPYF